MADVSYDQVLELAKRLTSEEKKALAEQLLKTSEDRELTIEERKALLEASILSIPFLEEPSPRREDWYDDDGR